MGLEELTEIERKVYEYIKAGDFQSNKWSTPKAARDLNLKEDDVYEAIANLTRKIKDRIWVYYEDGGIRIVVD